MDVLKGTTWIILITLLYGARGGQERDDERAPIAQNVTLPTYIVVQLKLLRLKVHNFPSHLIHR